MFYYYDSVYIFCAVIAFAITMAAHLRVQFMFSKYSKIKCQNDTTGLKSAQDVLIQNNVAETNIEHIQGEFNDHFDPRVKKIFLSEPIYGKNSITAVGVAAHEAGHAVQYSKKYKFIKIRQGLVPATQLCSNLAFPLVFIGLILPVKYNFIVNLGILLFSVAVLFQFITLPVEFDASRRAISALNRSGNFTEKELIGVKKVLNAAAMTYVAALFTSLINLLRLIFISSRRRK